MSKQSNNSNPPSTKKNNPSVSITKTEVGYSGPLPPPGFLQQYENILPGSAERLLTMIENQSAHRQEIEKMVIKSDTGNSKIGLIFGFVLSITTFVMGGVLIYFDKDITGLSLILGDLILLAGVFITGSLTRKKERENKQKQSLPEK